MIIKYTYKICDIVSKRTVFLFAFLLFKLCEMVLLFNNITDYFTAFFLIWGIIVVTRDLFTQRSFLNFKGALFLFFFLLVTGVTIICNYREGLYANLVLAARLAVIFMISYTITYQHDSAYFDKLLYHVTLIVTIFFFIVSFASLIIFYSNQRFMYYTVASAVQVRLGMQAGSFFGYLGASTSAAFCSIIAICCAAVVIILSESQRMRVFAIISMLFQLFILSIYNSRGGYLCAAFFAAGIAFFCMAGKIDFKWKPKVETMGKRLVMAVLSGIIVAAITFASFTCIRYVLIDSSSLLQTFKLNLQVDSAKGEAKVTYEDVKTSIEETTVRSDFQDDVSNARFFLWKTQLLTVKENLLLGVGPANVAMNFHRNIDQNQSRDYLKLAPNAHNAYLQVLVTNGILGMAVMMGFLMFIIVRGYKLIFLRDGEHNRRMLSIVLCAMFCTYLCNGMFEYFFITQQSVMNVLFLFFSGSIVYLCDYDGSPMPIKKDFITKILSKRRKQK